MASEKYSKQSFDDYLPSIFPKSDQSNTKEIFFGIKNSQNLISLLLSAAGKTLLSAISRNIIDQLEKLKQRNENYVLEEFSLTQRIMAFMLYQEELENEKNKIQMHEITAWMNEQNLKNQAKAMANTAGFSDTDKNKINEIFCYSLVFKIMIMMINT